MRPAGEGREISDELFSRPENGGEGFKLGCEGGGGAKLSDSAGTFFCVSAKTSNFPVALGEGHPIKKALASRLARGCMGSGVLMAQPSMQKRVWCLSEV